MRVLIVKTSSIGDIIHCFPAVTDAARALPGIRFDWVAEKSLADLCRWHPAIDRVVTVDYRRWRHRPVAGIRSGALRAFKERLRERRYDAVIDAQGLYKSAVITRWADGPRHGFDLASCREKLAPLAYQHHHRVPRAGHAIARQRRLFAAALGYPEPEAPVAYGLDRSRLGPPPLAEPYVVLLHGTAWRTKLWPVARWRGLAALAGAAGFKVCLTWHGTREQARAAAIARDLPQVVVLPPMDLAGVGGLLARAAGAVAVDTGLGHLAAALDVPAVSLYGPTGPARTGTAGAGQRHLIAAMPCSPCNNKICNHTGNARAPAACLAGIGAEQAWALLGL